MLDFLSVTWHRRSSCHCISWKATETKSFIGKHIILHQGSPQPALAMSQHANVMSGATSMHPFWRFYWEFNTSFQVLAGADRALSFGAEKPCTGTVQIFISRSCILGRIEDRCLVIKICPSSKVKTFRIHKANFLKEWT